ncbi:T-complex protein 10, putative [Trichomonas vaginalis G3]|uniref:T-complex protein 10, putative n=1 Tax=Trichomonas vaginalis (strain ATCC PRA-98 / G3) TaxID=412133 RepID=A2DUQ5_TRIV3|nr:centriole elongation [Trichomonas vaginalis G3]EAY15790.1 T-complex protein 10, putative [Trichomonas vaginalis G3]KAI5525040.1 centriole elongation [Trichomonas vaginalis G3]|eukprot:XP_001328013.1 T-complex protein 10 [Trichomonas vaginalis G3]
MEKDQASVYKSDEERELDNFCQLEEQLMAEEKESGVSNSDSKLAIEFPDTFIHTDGTVHDGKVSQDTLNRSELKDILPELRQKLTLVRKREAALLRSENWVQAEKDQLAKDKQKLEEEKKANEELISKLKTENEQLKKQLEDERLGWKEEKKTLIDQLDNYEKKGKHKVTFVTPDQDEHPEEEEKAQEETKEEEKAEEPEKSEEEEHNEIVEEEKPKKEEEEVPEKPVSEPEQVVPPAPEPKQAPKAKRPKIYKITVGENYILDFDYNPGSVFKEELKKGGRKDVKYKDGSTGTVFKDGTRKAIREINRQKKTYIFYANQDISIEFPDKAIAYKYKQTGAIELTVPDGCIYYLFKNGQKERHYPNGNKEVQFPNGIFKILRNDGDTETHYPDGKCEKVTKGKFEITYEYI